MEQFYTTVTYFKMLKITNSEGMAKTMTYARFMCWSSRRDSSSTWVSMMVLIDAKLSYPHSLHSEQRPPKLS
ncbi:unnamed protein product [Rhizophagus irregularis]|nr:unnamed protein product [Rhizophagus irregularis]